jgi:hypothetical protein
MIVVGVIGLQLFPAWTQKRQVAMLNLLLSLAVMDCRHERGAACAVAMIFVLGNAMTFRVLSLPCTHAAFVLAR